MGGAGGDSASIVINIKPAKTRFRIYRMMLHLLKYKYDLLNESIYPLIIQCKMTILLFH